MTAQGFLHNRRFVVIAALMLALIIGILIAEILAAGQPGMDIIISDAAPVTCSFIASGFFIWTWASISKKEVYKKVWGWATLGILLWTLAEIVWGYYEVILGIAIPYPSIADLFWLGGYVPLYLALSIAYRTYQTKSSRQQRLAIIGVVLAFSAASIFFCDPANFSELRCGQAPRKLNQCRLSSSRLGFVHSDTRHRLCT